MYFQLHPFARLISSIFSVSSLRCMSLSLARHSPLLTSFAPAFGRPIADSIAMDVPRPISPQTVLRGSAHSQKRLFVGQKPDFQATDFSMSSWVVRRYARCARQLIRLVFLRE